MRVASEEALSVVSNILHIQCKSRLATAAGVTRGSVTEKCKCVSGKLTENYLHQLCYNLLNTIEGIDKPKYVRLGY